MGKGVLIIGAGIAGLSAGSYLARNGYKVTILEQHSLAGGVCTSWKRKGYTIDYCVHRLEGTKSGTECSQLWEELGAFTNEDGTRTQTINFEYYSRIGLSNGDILCLFSDIAKLESEMCRVAPEDTDLIRKTCRSIKQLSKWENPVLTENRGSRKRAGYLMKNLQPSLAVMRHTASAAAGLAGKCRNALLREAFLAAVPGEWSLLPFSLGLAMQHSHNAGYPVGGSQNLSGNIGRTFSELGGVIRCRSRVRSISVSGSCALGAILESGEQFLSDWIISASDGYATLFRLLPPRELPEKLIKAYEAYPLFPSSIFVALGINADLSHLPHASIPYLDPPLEFGDGATHSRFHVRVHHYDPTLAPKGKTLVTVFIDCWPAAYWIDLKQKDPIHYYEQKEQIGVLVLDALEAHFGSIRHALEVIDVSTPATVERFTGNWKGSYEGFAPTPMALQRSLPKQLPGLKNFFMIGHWTSPGGGLVSAAKGGRDAALMICRRDKKPFRANR